MVTHQKNQEKPVNIPMLSPQLFCNHQKYHHLKSFHQFSPCWLMITIHRGDVSIIPYGPMDESQLSKVRGRCLRGWEEWMGHQVFGWLMIIVQHKVIRF